jgi:geranylgeranyl diphosphate synthase type I
VHRALTPLPAPGAPSAGPPGERHPLDAEDLRARVDDVLAGFLRRQEEALRAVSEDCVPLVRAVADLVRGGKRLRPGFCYWGWRGADGPDCDPIVTAAAALELFQAAALIHDDVIDASDTRRGMPAVHRRFAQDHAARGWGGAAERFGLAGAVLAGDLCLVWTDELLAGCGLPGERLAAARPVVNTMRTELLAGQFLDVLAQVAPEPPRQEAVRRARHVVRYKSAKYSVEQPLLIGGTLAGAPPGLLGAYSDYGLPLGEAFQLRDDVLGVFGDPARTGKPAGDDLREGKRTVLVALTLERADAQRAELVRRRLGDPRLDAAGVEEVRAVMVEVGALAAVEALIGELAGTARRALAAAEVPASARAMLEALIDTTTARNR